ncbi:protein of unknown function (DUF1840) [Methylophaga frappieri]|uniref:DUF1840 domain-containing protein n=1 Tax=Methylophaga frappieri (strain ATCC BAA-2434 / DSM 25690 / JAM7) TaxID=754477 RepID=I1YJ49_METFJ|nr:DUF1840 domain-containing protein [Methylophaga frappieri]AFJ02942.1 protein of unknown function (DUF1840) [Methylophaga frappieri]
MLVKFHTKAYADITMLGDVALTMLKIMGHSGTVPGAIVAADLPAALTRLQTAVQADKKHTAPDDPDAEFQPGLAQRALPLIELISAAISADADVMWDTP